MASTEAKRWHGCTADLTRVSLGAASCQLQHRARCSGSAARPLLLPRSDSGDLGPLQHNRHSGTFVGIPRWAGKAGSRAEHPGLLPGRWRSRGSWGCSKPGRVAWYQGEVRAALFGHGLRSVISEIPSSLSDAGIDCP